MTNEQRFKRVEDQVIDLNLAVSALIDTTIRYQENFEVLAREIREMRVDMREMQSEIRGLQTENRRILDEMQRRREEGDS